MYNLSLFRGPAIFGLLSYIFQEKIYYFLEYVLCFLKVIFLIYGKNK